MSKKIILIVSVIILGIVFIPNLFINTDEELLWKEVETSQKIEVINKYLEKYPEGKFVEEANILLEKHEYQDVIANPSVSSIVSFLNKFPDSEYKQEFLNKAEERFYNEISIRPSFYLISKYYTYYPNGTYKTKLDALYKQLLKNVDTHVLGENDINLVLNFDLPDQAELPIESEIKAILKCVNLKPSKTTDTALQLSITLTGTPLTMTYGARGSHYTGANIEGEYKITKAGKQISNSQFFGTEGCLVSLGRDDYSNPSDAPFNYAFYNSDLLEEIILNFVELYGPTVYNALLEMNGYYCQTLASEHLVDQIMSGAVEHVDVLASYVESAEYDFVKELYNIVRYKRGNYFDKLFIAGLKNRNRYVKADAITAIKADKIKSAADELIKLLDSKEYDIRARSAITLGEMGIQKSSKKIVKLLKDNHPFPRSASLKALTLLNATEYLPDIIEVLNTEDRNTKAEALRALINLTGEDFGGSYKVWKNWLSYQK